MTQFLFIFSLTTVISLATSLAMASTPPQAVAGIDKAREGDLQKQVLQLFQNEMAVPCDVNEIAAFDILKVSSSSMNREKKPGTPYDYEADYLVMQRCLSGSTFVGAYLSAVKSVILKASFHSKYNAQGGPEKMEDLKFEFVRTADLSVPGVQ